MIKRKHVCEMTVTAVNPETIDGRRYTHCMKWCECGDWEVETIPGYWKHSDLLHKLSKGYTNPYQEMRELTTSVTCSTCGSTHSFNILGDSLFIDCLCGARFIAEPSCSISAASKVSLIRAIEAELRVLRVELLKLYS